MQKQSLNQKLKLRSILAVKRKTKVFLNEEKAEN